MDFLSVQLYNGDGTFNIDEIEKFSRTANIAAWGYSYSVVSIIGPQSSGKSTLLNHLFQTKFVEMDAYMGRSKTTKGIWLGKAHETATLVIDIEGTDGVERGEDDTLYERQSALFALAISDVVLVNMWCHDIGREQGGSRPLLKNLFQVMLQMLSPRKRLLLFILRDKTRTPLENLEASLREGIQQIYDSVHKPDDHKDTPLSKFFIIQVTALSSFEEKKVEFKNQVTGLRLKIDNSMVSGGVLEVQNERVPASEFLYTAHQIWKTIKRNRDLDLPSLRVMVSNVRCEEIGKELLSCLDLSQDLNNLKKIVSFSQASSFKAESNAIVNKYLSEYNEKAFYFDEIVKTSKRQLLEDKLLHRLEPAYQSILEHLLSKKFNGFRKALAKARESEEFSVAADRCREQFLSKFEEECKEAAIEQACWDSSKFLDRLRYDINANIALLRTQSIEAELAASRKASSEQGIMNHTRMSMKKIAKLGVVLALGALGVDIPIDMV